MVLALAVGLTFAWPVVRPLRGMLVVFLVIYGVEGGLFLTLLPRPASIRTSSVAMQTARSSGSACCALALSW